MGPNPILILKSIFVAPCELSDDGCLTVAQWEANCMKREGEENDAFFERERESDEMSNRLLIISCLKISQGNKD